MKKKTHQYDFKTRKAITEVAESCRYAAKQLKNDAIEDPRSLLADLTKKSTALLRSLGGYYHPKAVDMVYCVRDGQIVRNVGTQGFEDSCSASQGFQSACFAAGGRVKGGCIG
jgi:hypothetical protein